MLAPQEHPLDIDRVEPPPFFEAGFGHGLEQEQSGIVDEDMFAEFRTVLEAALKGKAGKDLSPDYVGAVLSAFAGITFEFVAREPERRTHYRTLGFETFWKAIAS